MEHFIVAGGGLDNETLAQDDIEVLDWIENTHWRKVSTKLPEPMWGFTPIVYDDHLLIVGYGIANMKGISGAYKIPVADITASAGDQQYYSDNRV